MFSKPFGEVPQPCIRSARVRFDGVSCLHAERSISTDQQTKQTTNIAHLSAGRFAQLEFPLPPLAEQRRIVAKVDELMALVDALETQLTASRTKAAHLMEAVVAELTERD